jgi:hypothetical protein
MSTTAPIRVNSPTPIPVKSALVPPAPAAVGTASGDNHPGPRMRQVFHYSDLDSDPKSDYHDAILYMDEQSQDQLIIDLQREDLARNQFYCVTLIPPP